jgi:glycosyltransferase involved in cell wall biosynthesis
MNRPRLTVVVPVYNEERTLPALMERLQRTCGDDCQIIYVDDGSTDQSPRILRALAGPRHLILSKKNGGKGSAVRMGFQHALGRYTIIQDADLEYSPEEIPALLTFAEEHGYPAVFGSRRLKDQKQFKHLLFFIGGSMLTHLCNFLYRTKLTDQPTCYKLVLTDILKLIPLMENDFRFDPELTSYLARFRVPIVEFPISYSPRSVQEGKKINWKDWFRWVWVFVKLRVLPLQEREQTLPAAEIA